MNTTAIPEGIAQVTVYSKPACVQCNATKRALDKKGIAYREVDVTEVPAALEYVTEDLGYSMAPVVVVDEHNHWAGFRPDRIENLATALGLTA
ncbi:glutaredoxin-like protein NrdH [Sinomonas sp. JGH33]|uniref:Glutaredoxin-like protein NrdH n=1 Tax=Sinomonas terricola TaxID=3110330 RepID=A0ABU5TB56_9MICC|nr:glutaredoxin-like protein NrdH [Sinomonas sp. JGH33]MEA5456922.1 glutaredoxin-like protein NrdH [Sinomonas sp. JGH33]